MPELPEAENIARALKRVLVNCQIKRVEVFTPAMREPLTPLLSAGLENHRIIDVRRRGRYVVAELDDKRALLMHFGMSGVVRVESPEIPRRKHEHVFIHLDNGLIFRFECTRRFSLLKVCDLPKIGTWPAELDHLGVEPLAEEFNQDYLYKKSRGHKGCIKNFIMNNEIVVGIGNIYAAETLYAAGVSPLRETDSISRQECSKIAECAKRILTKAIAQGGTTISDFLNVDGSEGKFAQELAVYGKKGEPCPKCGTLIELKKIGGRSSYFCPKCQK